MKFEEVIPALREGKKIKVVGSSKSYQRKEQLYCTMKVYDILYSDWEIVKETKKVKLRDLTKKQYVKWRKNNCCINLCASSCPFKSINCAIGWHNYKEMYSDKFLDQEIEIEE